MTFGLVVECASNLEKGGGLIVTLYMGSYELWSAGIGCFGYGWRGGYAVQSCSVTGILIVPRCLLGVHVGSVVCDLEW